MPRSSSASSIHHPLPNDGLPRITSATARRPAQQAAPLHSWRAKSLARRDPRAARPGVGGHPPFALGLHLDQAQRAVVRPYSYTTLTHKMDFACFTLIAFGKLRSPDLQPLAVPECVRARSWGEPADEVMQRPRGLR